MHSYAKIVRKLANFTVFDSDNWDEKVGGHSYKLFVCMLHVNIMETLFDNSRVEHRNVYNRLSEGKE